MGNGKLNGKQAAWARLIVLVVLVVNQSLTLFGWNPLPWSGEEVYAGVSSLLLAAQGVYTWYRNNNTTKEAIEVQTQLDKKKEAKKERKKAKKGAK